MKKIKVFVYGREDFRYLPCRAKTEVNAFLERERAELIDINVSAAQWGNNPPAAHYVYTVTYEKED